MDACPKCAYARQPKGAVPPGQPDSFDECPRCGIVFAKYAKYHAQPVLVPAEGPVEAAEEGADELPPPTFWQRLNDRLFELPEKPDPVVMAAQALVLAVMVAWGVRLITYKVITAEIMYSFLHNVDLPIHEFGHVLFRPLGEWMMYLGGSLFQCLLPALIGAVFLFRQRNPFAAAFCLWWTAENVLDVAPYIRDAKLMAMPLVGEWNDEVAALHVLRHDWHNILLKFNAVDAAPALGSLAHTLGAALMALSWLWGGLWLWKAWRQQREAAW